MIQGLSETPSIEIILLQLFTNQATQHIEH